MSVELRQGGDPPRHALGRFLANPSAVAGAFICLAVAAIAVFAPQLAPYDPTKQFAAGLTADGAPLPPGPVFRLGTDQLGRDILSRIIWGSRVSLEVGLIATCVSAAVGIALGTLAGYVGGLVDDLVMRAADVLLAFPFLLLVILLAATGRPDPLTLFAVVGLFGWMKVARIMRGQVLSVRQASYVEAAVSLGASRWRVMARHVLPNAVGPVVVYSALLVSYYVALEATLGFFGLGVPPPTPDWGAMVAAGQRYFAVAPWMWAVPGTMIALTVLGFNLLGDGLDEAINPRLQRR